MEVRNRSKELKNHGVIHSLSYVGLSDGAWVGEESMEKCVTRIMKGENKVCMDNNELERLLRKVGMSEEKFKNLLLMDIKC